MSFTFITFASRTPSNVLVTVARSSLVCFNKNITNKVTFNPNNHQEILELPIISNTNIVINKSNNTRIQFNTNNSNLVNFNSTNNSDVDFITLNSNLVTESLHRFVFGIGFEAIGESFIG